MQFFDYEKDGNRIANPFATELKTFMPMKF